MEKHIELIELKKYFQSGIRGLKVQALDGLSLSVHKGEAFGLLGPNGAGKSTAIKIILGIIKQSAGRCLVFGNPLNKNAKKRIGYLPEAPNFYKFLSAKELVVFYARLCGMSKANALEAAMKAVDMVGLKDAADRSLAGYSKGMLQRAGLAQAIVHDPELVVLDEPSSGLDPVGMSDMAEMIFRLKEKGKTILLCSHLLNEVEGLCDKVAIISKGKLAATGILSEMLTLDGIKDIRFENLNDETLQAVKTEAQKGGAKIISQADASLSLSEYFRNIIKKDVK